ncbi:MAG: T9SS type A sorting domain-containing protein [Adhaeribacter sp.]
MLLIITAEEAAAAANQPDKLAAIGEVARTKGRPAVFSDILDPAAIESVDVFKQTAASLFGERGRNGVVVITLKKGQNLDSFIRKPAPQKGPSNAQPAQKNNIIIRGQNMKTAEKPYILVLEKPVAGIYEQVLSQETIRDILNSGKPIADLKELAPQDIAAMNALKGTSAQAFGDKGKNGLILITLKTAVPANSGTNPETSGDWMIYPNPSENIFKINIDLPGIEEIRISAYDAQNRLVGTIAKGSFWKGGHEFEWDASHLKPGYYIISLTKGKSTWRKRVIIK